MAAAAKATPRSNSGQAGAAAPSTERMNLTWAISFRAIFCNKPETAVMQQRAAKQKVEQGSECNSPLGIC